MSEKDSFPTRESAQDDGQWQGIARAIRELDMKLLELERELGISARQMPGPEPDHGDGTDTGAGSGQNNDI